MDDLGRKLIIFGNTHIEWSCFPEQTRAKFVTHKAQASGGAPRVGGALLGFLDSREYLMVMAVTDLSVANNFQSAANIGKSGIHGSKAWVPCSFSTVFRARTEHQFLLASRCLLTALSRKVLREKCQHVSTSPDQHEPRDKKTPHVPLNPGCLMTGSLFHGLWMFMK